MDSPAAPLYEACSKDKALWLHYTSYAIDEYITQVEETEVLYKILAEKPDLNEGDEILEEPLQRHSSAGSLKIL
jgi:hypothetical protein